MNGVPVAEGDVRRWTSRFHTVSARTPAVELVPGETVVFAVMTNEP